MPKRQRSIFRGNAVREILQCWRERRACYGRYHRGSGPGGMYSNPQTGTYDPIYTDGKTIWSYDWSHPIAHRGDDGFTYVLAPHLGLEDIRVPARVPRGERASRSTGDVPHYHSMTTKGQVWEIASAIAGRNRWSSAPYPDNIVCVRSFKDLANVVLLRNPGGTRRYDGSVREWTGWWSCPGRIGPPEAWVRRYGARRAPWSEFWERQQEREERRREARREKRQRPLLGRR